MSYNLRNRKGAVQDSAANESGEEQFSEPCGASVKNSCEGEAVPGSPYTKEDVLLQLVMELRTAMGALQSSYAQNQEEIAQLRCQVEEQSQVRLPGPEYHQVARDIAIAQRTDVSQAYSNTGAVPKLNGRNLPTSTDPANTTFLSSNESPATNINSVQISQNTPFQANPSQVNAKLYDLPKFTGNAEDWPLFKANYDESSNFFGYTNTQNLMRLQKSLAGAAKEAVASMLIFPKDVPNLVEELEFRFGRPELLVKTQINVIKQFPNISEGRLDQIVSYSTKVRNTVSFLGSAKCEQHLANPMLLEQMMLKLPINKQLDWARHANAIKPYATIQDFSEWLTELARYVALLPASSKPSGEQVPTRRVMHVAANKQSNEKPVEMKCSQCNDDHFITNCNTFREMTTSTRWERVKQLRLCFCCLRKGHGSHSCRSKKSCGVSGCKYCHHPMLHEESKGTLPKPVLNCRDFKQSTQLFKILPVTLHGPKGNLEIYAMFDEGAAISMLEENVAKQLGLNGSRQMLQLQWYGEQMHTEPSSNVNLEISGVNSFTKYNLKNVKTIARLNLPKQTFSKSLFPHLEVLPISDYKNVQPVLLIGLDHIHLGATGSIVENGVSSPIAAETKLGWVAYGPAIAKTSDSPIILHVRCADKLEELNMIVSEYIGNEINTDVPSISLESKEDSMARQILQQSTKLLNCRYETGLLWKNHTSKVPDSYAMAERRLTSIERKMERDIDYAKRYKVEMSKYIDKNYARKLEEHEVTSTQNHVWYLPHFGVVNPNKPGKLRIVFDAAAAIQGVSLNSMLLKGPEQLNSLLSILFKFREGSIAVAADIREMFSQIKIIPKDQHAQRFLWRENKTDPIGHYVMTSMIFGAICSPCSAEYVKTFNAEKFRSQFPEAVDVIVNKHYVDDLVSSFNSYEDALAICQNVIAIHAAAGFEIRGFVSNSKPLESILNKTDSADVNNVNMECQATTEKILGMYWNTVNDNFQFNTKFHKVPKPVMEGSRVPTKRELLSIVMAIFDPFGLLADFLIFSKLLIQETWRLKTDWDSPIPLEMHKKWFAWWNAFHQIRDFKIARHYCPHLHHCNDIQLHIFVDASQVAIAAVGYFRISFENENFVTFVAGKTKCASIKITSIPRLELQAAVLGTRLSRIIQESHEVKVNKVVFWSDSRTVLHWIYSSTRKYKPYVTHRIASILNTTNEENWRWVPTNQNSADAATRPNHPPKIVENGIWTEGPRFLKESEDVWPNVPIVPPSTQLEEEVKPLLLIKKTKIPFVLITRFSSFRRLLKTIVFVRRAVHVFKSKKNGNNSTSYTLVPSVTEINDAEKLICRIVQEEEFKSEIIALRENFKLSKQSSIRQLTPYLDGEGLIRMQGRIDEAVYLPESARRPILLPKKHVLSMLIFKHYHEKNFHQNAAITINEIRQKFWIPNARTGLEAVRKNCMICKINMVKPKTPLMGSLPADRVTPYVRPFSYTGVDMFGPLNVSIGRRREKRWGVLFTCLTIRAAHIELAENLSADAFIICLRNFINRRGTPVKLRSDNGTNFIGAQRELDENRRLMDTDKIQAEANSRQITWIFNCPASPNAGGCWERLIGITKRFLHQALKDDCPRVNTLISVLIEAENIINSRPLTDIPLLAEEDEPITPNHFLIGCVNSTQTPHPDETSICLRKQWLIAQNLKNRLWKRWIVEYLPKLLTRPKWQQKVEPLKTNDLVIVCDPNKPRSQWQKGRITQVFPAKDGQVRYAEVRTSTGLYRRPASRLAALTVENTHNGESGSIHGGENVATETC